MSDYKPPVSDMMHLLRHVGGIETSKPFADAELDVETVQAVLEEASKLASDVLAPLNHSGDTQGSKLNNGSVKTPDGFADAYKQFCDNGWNAVPFEPDFGGQGLPWLMNFALHEMWQGANMSFGLCPMLTQAAVEALQEYGTEEQKKTYLQKLISGEWTGSMQLTEPQAGTDLAALKTKAVKQDDGSYKISGQKIYITYGEHDWTDNIVHMVLARTPEAPEGVKGISMFLVPKFLPDDKGAFTVRNDVYASGLEHKLGIHASPTCTMQYGDQGGATGYLIGNENEGLKNMFIMMNNARLAVGLQGVAIAERAYQHALQYAKDRVQGKAIDDKDGERVAIIEHADIRRMLLSMQSRVMAGRALVYEAGAALDEARSGDKDAQVRVNLLTPIVKAWCTDMANDAAALGVQVHGGMGFIEETGAAQYVRDARILSIYEGTNGVQAQDLYIQKFLKDKGAGLNSWLKDAWNTAAKIKDAGHKAAVEAALRSLETSRDAMLQKDLVDGSAASVPFAKMFGTVAASLSFAKAVNADDAPEHMKQLFDFYVSHILPEGVAQQSIIESNADTIKKYNFG